MYTDHWQRFCEEVEAGEDITSSLSRREKNQHVVHSSCMVMPAHEDGFLRDFDCLLAVHIASLTKRLNAASIGRRWRGRRKAR